MDPTRPLPRIALATATAVAILVLGLGTVSPGPRPATRAAAFARGDAGRPASLPRVAGGRPVGLAAVDGDAGRDASPHGGPPPEVPAATSGGWGAPRHGADEGTRARCAEPPPSRVLRALLCTYRL